MAPPGENTDIYVISDGKAGHLNQSLGLAEALCRLRPEATVRVEAAVADRWAVLRTLLPVKGGSTGPALVIGAGHGTHSSLLKWRGRGGRSIVLMRPSLPLWFFDLCIEPRHDGGVESDRRWLSDGPLNRIRPAFARQERGLILIGGPSPHFQWDTEALLRQLVQVCRADAPWSLSTSRRTPPDFLQAIKVLSLPGLDIFEPSQLPEGWLARELPRASRCWVTPDSASMVYEALTAGCAVGLFDLPATDGSRIAAGVSDLRARELCLGFSDVARGAVLSAPASMFAEADRCAARIVQKGWL
jgi:mitochondrial fission protein ELM1